MQNPDVHKSAKLTAAVQIVPDLQVRTRRRTLTLDSMIGANRRPWKVRRMETE